MADARSPAGVIRKKPRRNHRIVDLGPLPAPPANAQNINISANIIDDYVPAPPVVSSVAEHLIAEDYKEDPQDVLMWWHSQLAAQTPSPGLDDEEVDQDPNVKEVERRLIPHPQSDPRYLATLFRMLTTLGQSTANGARNSVAAVHENPYLLILLPLIAITALPNGIFAFTSKPSKIREVIAGMTRSQLMLASTKAFFAWLINALMNISFAMTAVMKIKNIGEQGIILAFLILLLAGLAALGAGAVGYNAFLWLPMGEIFAAVPALLYLAVNFASRIVGVNNVFTTLRNIFSADAKVQRELADKLKHVNMDNAEYKQLMNDSFNWVKRTVLSGKPANYKLTDHDFEKIYERLATMISIYNATYEDFIREPNNTEIALNHAKLALQIFYSSLGLIFCVLPYGLTYLQKGRDGINILLSMMGNIFGVTLSLDNLSTIDQFFSGLASGVATGALAFTSYKEAPSTVARIFHEVTNDPVKALPAALLLGGNGLSAAGAFGVTKSVVDEPNVVGFQPGALGTTIEYLSALMAFIINSRYSMEQALLKKDDAETKAKVTYDSTLTRMEDTTNHRICSDAATALKRNMIFAKDEEEDEDDATHHEAVHSHHKVHSIPGIT